MIGFCFNKLSCTTLNKENAFMLTKNMYKGLTYIISEKLESSVIYADEIIDNIELFNGYTHKDFINEIKNNDRDFYAFVTEITDHSPFANRLTDDDQNNILDFGNYFKLADESLNNIEYLYIFAYKKNFYLASLASNQKWAICKLQFEYYDNNSHYISCMLPNVSSYDTGYYHINSVAPLELNRYEGRLHYSKHFTRWFMGLDEVIKKYVISRINQAYCVNFNCEPITKRLHLNLSKNISEIRGNNLPVGAGTMRILFYEELGMTNILYGWIKEGNSDGYKSAKECCRQLLIEDDWE